MSIIEKIFYALIGKNLEAACLEMIHNPEVKRMREERAIAKKELIEALANDPAFIRMCNGDEDILENPIEKKTIKKRKK